MCSVHTDYVVCGVHSTIFCLFILLLSSFFISLEGRSIFNWRDFFFSEENGGQMVIHCIHIKEAVLDLKPVKPSQKEKKCFLPDC